MLIKLFDKLSKGIFKKYQTSKTFKEIVKPVNTGYAKSESFQIKKEDTSRNEKTETKCC
jgi:hypothetical protein